MPSARAVVAPASPPKTPFEVFGVPERFAQDAAALEKQYYTLSRELHPDRFATADSVSRAKALEQMSLINEAYGVLRDRARLREWFLGRAGLLVEGKGPRAAIPKDLAEEWFELQDACMGGDPAAVSALSGFVARLKAMKEERARVVRALEDAFDDKALAERDAILRDIAGEVQTLAYLGSLERDVAVLRSKVGF